MPRRIDPYKIADIRARDAEYQAMWQACDRTARKDHYLSASASTRILMLHEALTNLTDRRRRQGKQMCGTSIDLMVERHIRREAIQAREPCPPPSRQEGIHPGNMESLGLVNSDASPGLILTAPMAPTASMGCPDVAPAMKPEPKSYRASIVQEAMYHPTRGDAERNDNLLSELANCQADRSLLARQVQALKKDMDNMKGMISALWNYLHPGMMMVPQTPKASGDTGEERHAVMN